MRTYVASAFLPAMLYEIGNGAAAPVIAIGASDLGASAGLAGFVLALIGIGRVLGDLPSAAIAARLGERSLMTLAAAVSAAAFLACAISHSLLVLSMALLVVGLCSAAFYLARQTYLIEVVPLELRARALSSLAGSHRIGLFIGPFIGGAAISLGGLHAAYLTAALACAVTVGVLYLVEDVTHVAVRPGEHSSSVKMISAHRQLFLTLGLAIVAMGAIRAARQTVLPLWANVIGLSPATTSLIFGLTGVGELVLFYPAGRIMDQFGRLAIAVPASLVMAASMILLPLCHTPGLITLAALGLSVGNGIGSGVIMTLGADVAPAQQRVHFLGAWRLMSDAGNAAGPAVMAAIAAATTVAIGITATATCGLLAAGGLARWMPRYSIYATRRSTQAAHAAHAEARVAEARIAAS
jgi:MFS family permease